MAIASLDAPHSPYDPSPAHAHDFDGFPLPWAPSFDEADVSDKPGFVRKTSRLTNAEKAEIRHTYEGKLEEGAANGGRRHRPQTPYTTDSPFPLIVTGPGVREGDTRPEIVLNTDLAPTFAAWGRTSASSADGRSFAPLLGNPDAPWREAGLVEGAASKRSPITPGNPAYEAVRTEEGLYVEYETGERELYDLGIDPHQPDNLTGTRHEGEANLSARLQALKVCVGNGCKSAEGP